MVDVERAVGLELRFAFVVVLQVGVSPSADQVRTVDLARTDFDDEIVGRTRYFGRRRGHGPCPDPLPVGILHVCRQCGGRFLRAEDLRGVIQRRGVDSQAHHDILRFIVQVGKSPCHVALLQFVRGSDRLADTFPELRVRHAFDFALPERPDDVRVVRIRRGNFVFQRIVGRFRNVYGQLVVRVFRSDPDVFLGIFQVLSAERQLFHGHAVDGQRFVEFRTGFRPDEGRGQDLCRFGFGGLLERNPEYARGKIIQSRLEFQRIGRIPYDAARIAQQHFRFRIYIGLQFIGPVHALIERIHADVIAGFASFEFYAFGSGLHNDEVGIPFQTAVRRADSLIGPGPGIRIEMNDLVVGVEREHRPVVRLYGVVGLVRLRGIEILAGGGHLAVGREFQEHRITSVDARFLRIELHAPPVDSTLKNVLGLFDGFVHAFRRGFREFILLVQKTGAQYEGQPQQYQ